MKKTKTRDFEKNIEQKKRGSGVFFVQFVFQNRAFCVVDVIYIM